MIFFTNKIKNFFHATDMMRLVTKILMGHWWCASCCSFICNFSVINHVVVYPKVFFFGVWYCKLTGSWVFEVSIIYYMKCWCLIRMKRWKYKKLLFNNPQKIFRPSFETGTWEVRFHTRYWVVWKVLIFFKWIRQRLRSSVEFLLKVWCLWVRSSVEFVIFTKKQSSKNRVN